MKLSTRGHYGIHAMMDLAERYGEGAVLLRDLCEKRGYSEKYVEQLLRLLREDGLIKSVRGARGGFWLARPPEEITVLQILESLEGDFRELPSKCICEEHERKGCAILDTWFESVEALRKNLGRITLSELVLRQREAGGPQK